MSASSCRLAELFVNKNIPDLNTNYLTTKKKYISLPLNIFIKYYHIPNSVQRRAAALSCHTMFFFSFCICLSRIKYCYSSCLRSQLARTQKKNTRTISTWHDYAHTHAENLSHTARKKKLLVWLLTHLYKKIVTHLCTSFGE